MLLQHHTQPLVAAVDAIAEDPGARHASLESCLHHCGANLRLGCENHIVRHIGFLATFCVLSPILWQIKAAVGQPMSLWRVVAEDLSDLTVLNRPCCAGLWTRAPDRWGAFFKKAGLVKNKTAGGIPEPLYPVVAAYIPCTITFPATTSKHRLHPPRNIIAGMFSQLPAVLALNTTYQAVEIKPNLLTCVRTLKYTTQPLLQCSQLPTPSQRCHR